MINDWSYRPVAIVEADDFCDRYDRNGLNYLFWWKSKYPNFKITLFTIPDRTSPALLKSLPDWIEIAVHGFNHESNFECYGWDREKTAALMDRVGRLSPRYQKIFKAPGWTITPGYNGYPANNEAPISKDPTAVYKALTDLGYLIFDRHYNLPARPEESRFLTVCVDCNPKIVHMHTWNMETGDKAGRNGFGQVEEEQGVPWDINTEFHTVSEAFELGLFDSCKNG